MIIHRESIYLLVKSMGLSRGQKRKKDANEMLRNRKTIKIL